MFIFTLKEPNRRMSLRIEMTGEETVTEIRRIANEFWMEDGFVLRNGCSVLRDDEKVSDVILNDDTVFLMALDTARTQSTDRLSCSAYASAWQTDSGHMRMSF